jgi:hypothetical protein
VGLYFNAKYIQDCRINLLPKLKRRITKIIVRFQSKRTVGIATDYGLDDRMIGVRNFSPHHRFQTASGAHPPPQPPVQWIREGSFPAGEAAEAWSWPFTTVWCRGQRMRGGISPPLYVFVAWCLVKHRDNFTYTFKSRGTRSANRWWGERGRSLLHEVRFLCYLFDEKSVCFLYIE